MFNLWKDGNSVLLVCSVIDTLTSWFFPSDLFAPSVNLWRLSSLSPLLSLPNVFGDDDADNDGWLLL